MTMIKILLTAASLSIAALTTTGAADAKPLYYKPVGPKLTYFPGKIGPKKPIGGYHHGGAAAAGFIGGMALGAIAASAAQPAAPIVDDGCYTVRRKVWSDEFGGFVLRRVTVCD